jgi:hypothetical protein
MMMRCDERAGIAERRPTTPRSWRARLVVVVAVVASACARPPSGDITFGVGTEEHAPFFPIDPQAVHALDRAAVDGPITCVSCHTNGGTFTAFSCVSCHEHRQHGVDADGSRGMDEVHAGKAGYRYESGSCLSCHATGNAAEVSRAAHGDFPIAEGSAHAATSCAGCHIDGSNRAVVTCAGCHDDTDGDGAADHDAAPMAAVHGTEMAALGYVWETSACLSCHARAEVPGRLDHDAVFPVSSGTTHAGKSCVDCHTSRTDRAALSCTGCHEARPGTPGTPGDAHGEAEMRAVHDDGALPGYQWESGSCYACHQQAQVPGSLDHERFFPVGAGSVHAIGASIDDPAVVVSCESCHQDPSDTRNVTCTTCHAHDETTMAPTHTPFPDYEWDSTSCIFCHEGGQKRLNHTFFPVGAGSVHVADDPATSAVDGLTCSQCHASQIDRRALACTTCHDHAATTEAQHHGTEMTRFGYSFDSSACFGCHATSQVPGRFDHEPIWPLLPPSGAGAHDGRACVDCHSSRENRAANLSCTSCHEATSAEDARDVHGQPRLAEVHTGIPGYAFTPTVCVECHTDGTAASAATNLPHDGFPIGAGQTHAVTGNGGALSCADCHVVDGSFALATLDCRGCHQQVNDGAGPQDVHGQARLQTIHGSVSGYQYTTPSCLECHPRGEPAGNIAHDDFPIAASTAHAGVGCNDCHGAGARTDRTSLQCAQCHTSTVNRSPTIPQIHNGVPSFAATSPDCLRCHPQANPVGPMPHDAYFPIQTGSAHGAAAYAAKVGAGETSCTACHLSRTDRTQEDCAACHASVPPALSTSHSRVRGFSATSSTGCKQCHADAQVYRLSSHGAISPTHHGARCAQCHVRTRTDKPWAINFSATTSCSACHNSSCSITNRGPCN